VIAGLGSNVTTVAGGQDFSVALSDDASVWTWGANDQGQLGDGSAGHPTPLQVPANDLAQLGRGYIGFSPSPAQVLDLTNVVQIAAGSWGSLALRLDNSLWTWGRSGNLINQRPREVTGLPYAVGSIAAGGDSFFFVGGTLAEVWSWGSNVDGRLGDGTTTSRGTPQRLSFLSGVYEIVAAGGHTAAWKIDGTLWTWGQNRYGVEASEVK